VEDLTGVVARLELNLKTRTPFPSDSSALLLRKWARFERKMRRTQGRPSCGYHPACSQHPTRTSGFPERRHKPSAAYGLPIFLAR
jgi:hypothetical protein